MVGQEQELQLQLYLLEERMFQMLPHQKRLLMTVRLLQILQIYHQIEDQVMLVEDHKQLVFTQLVL